MTESTEGARAQLIELLEAKGAHMPFEAAVANFPANGIEMSPEASTTP